MNLRRFLAPSSETGSLRKRTSRKFFSIVLASLALSSVTFNTARDLPSTHTDEAQAGVVSVPRGLTRRRPAFRKAIEILTDRAGTNECLTNYLDGLTNRVNGGTANGDNNSGVSAVKHLSGVRVGGMVAIAGKATDIVGARAELISERSASAATSASSSYSIEKEAAPFVVGDMAFDTNPAIQHWMNYYTTTPIGRQTIMIGFERSNAYLEMARAEFRSAGVPEDLVWLAFVESAWNPRAISPAAAGGIWQFIPATATDYGLRVRSGDDERADPFKQTRVAAIYLHDLYTIFGDWALAMAAYNSGEPRVMGAIVRNGSANFWDLCEKELLPRETRDYVPKILAAIRIAGSAQDYGLVPRASIGAYTGS